MENLTSVLRSRLAWYNKAIAMATSSIAWENHFDWPTFPGNPLFGVGGKIRDSAICEFRGAARELQNTLDMMGSKR